MCYVFFSCQTVYDNIIHICGAPLVQSFLQYIVHVVLKGGRPVA